MQIYKEYIFTMRKIQNVKFVVSLFRNRLILRSNLNDFQDTQHTHDLTSTTTRTIIINIMPTSNIEIR